MSVEQYPRARQKTTRRLHVLHTTNELSAGGVSSVVLDLALEQRSRGLQVELAVLTAGEWDNRARDAGLMLHVGPKALLRAARHSTLVHSHHRATGLMAASAPSGAGLIHHVHNYFHNRRQLSFRGGPVIAVSADVAEHTRRTFRHTATRVEVIHNGVPSSAARRITPPESNTFRIVGAGRLSEQKRPELFVQIITALRAAGLPVSATWFGEGPAKNSVRELITKSGVSDSLTVVSWVPRAAMLDSMAHAHLLLISSRWEGLPLVALEALSVGTPVATTECGDIADIIRYSSAGIAVSEDPKSAAASAMAFLSRDQTAARLAATRLFDDRFSLTAFCDQVIEAYAQASDA